MGCAAIDLFAFLCISYLAEGSPEIGASVGKRYLPEAPISRLRQVRDSVSHQSLVLAFFVLAFLCLPSSMDIGGKSAARAEHVRSGDEPLECERNKVKRVRIAPDKTFGDGFFREDGRLHHTETFFASTEVPASELSTCVPGAEAVYMGPPIALSYGTIENPFNPMSTRTAKAYDQDGARDFNEDEYEALKLRTNAKVRVCTGIGNIRPPEAGKVIVHYVIDETVVGENQPPRYEIDPTGNAETPHCRVIDALPAPCAGGCGVYANVHGCHVQ